MGFGVALGTVLVASLAERAINSKAIGNGQTVASASLGGAFGLLDGAFRRLVDPTVPAISDHSKPAANTSTPTPTLPPLPGANPHSAGPLGPQTPSTGG